MTPEQRACLALDGLSVGDALGEQFFSVDASQRIARREIPPAPWPYTDDTEMAISVTECLLNDGEIDSDKLAAAFVGRYQKCRGYGRGAHQFMAEVRGGKPWRRAAQGLFGGRGSFGNGAAMRVAPVGAYFAANIEEAARQAERSAVVTHAHPEGVAGAIAVAVAAAAAWANLDTWAAVLDHTPTGGLRRALRRASEIGAAVAPEDVAVELGSGQKVTAADTVPFAIWCATHTNSFEDCFWRTVSGLGDRDTTCAIACAIAAVKNRSVPRDWLDSRENLPISTSC